MTQSSLEVINGSTNIKNTHVSIIENKIILVPPTQPNNAQEGDINLIKMGDTSTNKCGAVVEVFIYILGGNHNYNMFRIIWD